MIIVVIKNLVPNNLILLRISIYSLSIEIGSRIHTKQLYKACAVYARTP